MATENNRGKEKIVQNIKDCGQALIDDAENIVNSCNLISDIRITCWVTESDGVPYYNVDTNYYPKAFMDRRS